MNMYVEAKQYPDTASMLEAYTARHYRLRGKTKPVNWKPEPKKIDPGPKPVVRTREIKSLEPFTLVLDMPEWMSRETWFDDHLYRHSVRAYIYYRSRQLGFTSEEVASPARNVKLTFARHLIMWEIRNVVKPSMSYPEMARYFGNRDHSTVLWGIKRIQAMKDRGEIE